MLPFAARTLANKWEILISCLTRRIVKSEVLVAKFMIERSADDPNLYFCRRMGNANSWSSRMAVRAPYDLLHFLKSEGFSDEDVEGLKQIKPGNTIVVERG